MVVSRNVYMAASVNIRMTTLGNIYMSSSENENDIVGEYMSASRNVYMEALGKIYMTALRKKYGSIGK
ncbi:hypothetical protein [Eubacterium sp.]|uniref:hypothetical protein n=1 Tax=Eubacterium sp. TaxID=142586 RepID=UPI002588F3B6|nr:hypothetical protein [Eubacterium sp.]MCR5368022.1 hypothetical protein [Eubacterium sp.]